MVNFQHIFVVIALSALASLVASDHKQKRSIGAQVDPILEKLEQVAHRLDELEVEIKKSSFAGKMEDRTSKILKYWERHFCPFGFVKHKYSCYRLVNEHLTHTAAAKRCETYGAHLVEIGSPQEQTLAKSLVKGSTQHIWTGGIYTPSTKAWTWQTSGKKLSYTDWYTGQPNVGSSNFCLMLLKANLSNKWYAHPCGKKYLSICEI